MFGAFTFRNIDRRADHLDQLPIGIQNGMAYAMCPFDFTVRQDDSVFHFGIDSLIDDLREGLKETVPVFRVYSLERLVTRG